MLKKKYLMCSSWCKFLFFLNFQANEYDAKSHHEMLLQKQLPLPIPENLDDLKLQNEAFLQELQNHFAGKSGKASSPVSQAAALLGSPSAIMPFLPYLQHPYAPMPNDGQVPWNVQQNFNEDAENSMKKSRIGGFVDTPLNLSKPKSAEEIQKSMKMSANDGNNNTNKNHAVDHLASGSKQMSNQPRHPYNLPFNGEESDLFAACRLWPVMAAAAQHHHHNTSTSQSNNLPNMLSANHRDMIAENNFANFTQAMAESSGKKRGSEQMSQSNASEDKVRVVRQQGRGSRNSADRDLMGKQWVFDWGGIGVKILNKIFIWQTSESRSTWWRRRWRCCNWKGTHQETNVS